MREYERAVVFRLGRLLPVRGPGLVLLLPGIDRHGARRPAHRDLDDPAAGRDHARQRARARGGRLLLPGRRPGGGDHADRGVRARDVTDRADDAALGARRRRPRPAAEPSASGSTRISSGSSTSRPSRGASRSRSWRSRTSRSPRRCSARWRGRRRPSASAAPRSSAPRASIQAAEKLAGAAAILGREPSALQLRYLQTLVEVGADQSSTIVFPLPLDLLTPFLERAGDGQGAAHNGAAVTPAARPVR